MNHEILVPVDFSDHSRAALEHAVGLARRTGAMVTPFHVVNTDPPPVAPVEYVGIPAPISARDQAEADLNAFLESVSTDDVTVGPTVAEGRDASVVVLERIEETEPDLVVIGTHGRTGLAKLILGSHAMRIVRRSTAPVLLVNASQRPSSADETPYARILAAIDYSEPSMHAARAALEWAERLDADLTLLNVADIRALDLAALQSAGCAADEQKRLRAASVSRMEEMVSALGDSRPIRQEVVVGIPTDEILCEQDSWDADLVVVGTHGETGVRRVVLGSEAEAVLRRCSVPVLVVHTPKETTASSTGTVGAERRRDS